MQSLRSQAVLSPHESLRVSSQVSTFPARTHLDPSLKSISFGVVDPSVEWISKEKQGQQGLKEELRTEAKAQLPTALPSSPTNIEPRIPTPTAAPSALKFFPVSLTSFPPAAPPPLDVETIRADLTQQLEEAKEANRQLYMSSARRMIEMQEKIDALTKENVKLIRSLAPQSMQW